MPATGRDKALKEFASGVTIELKRHELALQWHELAPQWHELALQWHELALKGTFNRYLIVEQLACHNEFGRRNGAFD